jgi:hypothetical protein
MKSRLVGTWLPPRDRRVTGRAVLPALPGRHMTTADTRTIATAEQFWGALRQARSSNLPRTLAAVEDAQFRYYLPMARSMAARHQQGVDDCRQAAEVGLADAILSWRHGRVGFDRFARRTITAQLRRHHPPNRSDQRPRRRPGPVLLWTHPEP